MEPDAVKIILVLVSRVEVHRGRTAGGVILLPVVGVCPYGNGLVVLLAGFKHEYSFHVGRADARLVQLVAAYLPGAAPDKIPLGAQAVSEVVVYKRGGIRRRQHVLVYFGGSQRRPVKRGLGHGIIFLSELHGLFGYPLSDNRLYAGKFDIIG